MRDGPTGWSEPTPQRLAQAMDSYDHIVEGGKPRNPVENGIRLMRELNAEQGIVDDDSTRNRSVSAVARVMDVDDEIPKARVNSLMAARMMIVDVSLQRDAAIASGMDVLDTRQWFSGSEAGARRAAWMMAPDMPDILKHVDDRSVDALASGEFHFVGGRMGAAMKTSMEGMRQKGSVLNRSLDVDLMEKSGILSSEEAMSMRSRLVHRDQRLDVGDELHSRSRKASLVDERRWPDPTRKDREFPSDTGIINLRMRGNDRNRHAGIPVAEVGKAHHDMARDAIADSRLSNPDTENGRAVKAAMTVLTDLGAEQHLLQGPAFDRTVASAIAAPSSHDWEGIMPDAMGARIVGATMIRREAEAYVANRDLRFPSASEREASWKRLDEVRNRKGGIGFNAFLTSSKRDDKDMTLIAQGRFDETSERFGMRSNLNAALSGLSDGSKPLALTRLELDAMSSSPRKDLERLDGPDDRAPVSMSKGPESPQSGSDWIASMASLAKGGATR